MKMDASRATGEISPLEATTEQAKASSEFGSTALKKPGDDPIIPTPATKLVPDIQTSNRKAGYLTRRGRYMQTWQPRWFVLEGDYSSSLSYFTDNSERNKRGTIKIDAECTVSYIAEKHGHRNVLQLVTDELRFYASAESKESCESWISSIQRIIDFEKSARKYQKELESTRPAVSRALNALCSIPQTLQLSYWGQPNDIHTAVTMAKKETGLTDFGFGGEDFMVEGYDLVRRLGMLRSEAEYTALGYYIVLEGLSNRARDRLKLVEYVKRHPGIDDIPVRAPVWVVGFPRTGTTFLHELLGLHPSVRMHYTWEQYEPVPNTNDDSRQTLLDDRTARYQKNQGRFQLFLSIGGDDIQSIHRIGYDEPEECTLPLSLSLPWNIPEIPFNAFAAREIIDRGAGPSFQIYRKYLQMLTWQCPERKETEFTWMLKCPFHLPYLSELNEAFPDATVVWTHRDPVECIASACSLYETIMHWVMVPESVNRFALGKAVMQYTRAALDKALDSLDRMGSSIKIVHVRYADNIKAPKEICRQVVLEAGLPFSVEYERRIDVYLAKNAEERAKMKEAKGAAEKLHEYSLEDYGLTSEEVRDRFEDYTSRFRLVKGAP